MSFPNAMSGWPEHMYIDDNGKRNIRCLATGCRHTFKTDEETQLQVEHYKERASQDPDNDTIRIIHHRILMQMHKLQRCLVCGTDFKLPDSKLPDSRALFEHNRKDHPGEKDVSKIQGFIVHVRKFPYGFALDTDKEKKYCQKTFQAVFQHLEWTIKVGPERLWLDFHSIMGDRDNEMSNDKLREILTFDPTEYLSTRPDLVALYSQIKYLPIHPDIFLGDLKYDVVTSPLLKEDFHALRTKFRNLYREGKI